MRERLKSMVSELSYDDLRKMREELLSGRLGEHVDGRIEVYENPQGVCPVCERGVTDSEDIVLHFGPNGLRKKARFCGVDCLEYFLYELKKEKIQLSKSLSSEFE